jgi:hypothetical protein
LIEKACRKGKEEGRINKGCMEKRSEEERKQWWSKKKYMEGRIQVRRKEGCWERRNKDRARKGGGQKDARKEVRREWRRTNVGNEKERMHR